MIEKDICSTQTPAYIDPELFETAKEKGIGHIKGQNGIGTLSEKTVHAVLKYYYAPNENYHEVKLGNFVADIMVDGEITEIQTRNFNTMRKKLAFFLKDHDVTIVYPIVYTKWLKWIDEETGEVSKPRKSSKRGTIYTIIPELYKIKPQLKNEHLHFILSFIDVEESRILNGWSKDKKRGSTRDDGIPVRIVDELHINTFSDYTCFLSKTLPEEFTSVDLSKEAKINRNQSTVLLGILYEIGIVERIGKVGNAYKYKKVNQ